MVELVHVLVVIDTINHLAIVPLINAHDRRRVRGALRVGLSRHELVQVPDDVRYLRVEVGVRFVPGGGVAAVARGAEVLRRILRTDCLVVRARGAAAVTAAGTVVKRACRIGEERAAAGLALRAVAVVSLPSPAASTRSVTSEMEEGAKPHVEIWESVTLTRRNGPIFRY